MAKKYLDENGNQEILVSMDYEGVHLVHPKVVEAFEKKNISASLITGIETCPAKWAISSFVESEVVEQEPDNAARRGSLFHQVMENFFALPPEERTTDRIKEEVDTVLQSDEYVDLSTNPEVIAWIRDAVNGYYTMGAKPQNIKIAKLSVRGQEPQDGLEIFVKGKIGKAKRQTLGFIDRVIYNNKRNDGSIVIEDYKSGAKAKKYKKHLKSMDGWPEARQQLIYTILLRQDDIDVSGARLIFPVARDVVNVDVDDQELLEKVIEDVEKADKALDNFAETNTFEYKPSFICAWCVASPICPVAQIKPYAKMQEAYAKQPEPEVLETAIELK